MPADPVISIIVPTYNRLTRLKRCVEMIRANVAVSCEIIIVDGGSTDGTRPWLAEQSGLRVILEDEREGAVRAFNKGFKAATADYVMWLNDDAYPLPGSVTAALNMLRCHDEIGMIAFYHDWDRERNVLDSVYRAGRRYSIFNVRGYPYANFGLISRSLLKQIDYADERYYFFAFDPDLSLKVQLEAGLKVVGCPNALIHHEELHDPRKLTDLEAGAEDNAKLFTKWNLPAPNTYPDPAPTYHRMLQQLACAYPEGTP